MRGTTVNESRLNSGSRTRLSVRLSRITQKRDFAYNGAAFGAYILVLQVIVMPGLGRMSTPEEFSTIILFVSLYSIVCNVLGDELGNTLLVRTAKQSGRVGLSDYSLILGAASLALVTASLVLILLGVPWAVAITYLAITQFGVVRYFAVAHWKLDADFNRILFMNLFYAAGAGLGLAWTHMGGSLLAPFLLGEVLATTWVYLTLRTRLPLPRARVSPVFGATLATFGSLAFASLILNALVYLDRLIILPLLGATAMAAYYAASSMSKSLAVAINPVTGVFLARLARVEDGQRHRMALSALRFSLPIVVVLTVVGTGISYGAVWLLYPQYLGVVIGLIPLIALANALASAAFMVRPVIMRFQKSSLLIVANLGFAVVQVLGFFYFSAWWGLVGFVAAGVAGRAVQLGSYLALVRIPPAARVKAQS